MMHMQTHIDWGTASFTMAWKLTEQEMKERKLDLETFRARSVIRNAINTEAVLGLTEEQCYDLATFDAHFDNAEWSVSARARMRAHAQELLAAPNPAPAGHISTAPFQEETAKLGDGSLCCYRYITKFNADAQEVVAEFVVIRVGAMDKLQQEDAAKHEAGEAERRLQELSTMGMCKWERVIKLREEDVIARSVTRAPAGTPRHTSYFSNALNTEAVLGISKEDLEDRGDFEEGLSPGAKLIEVKMLHTPVRGH